MNKKSIYDSEDDKGHPGIKYDFFYFPVLDIVIKEIEEDATLYGV
ncbi:MAG TPA: hypothetical protein PKE38_16740 [Ignavibacteriaceae bacterium]|nr:hypothetical protein [Ignavibacteriaceae bacterium]